VNIVFDIGNVLNEWNPVQLIETHFAHALPVGMNAREFSVAMLSEDCWIAYDHGTVNTAQLCARLASRLNCDEAALRTFVETIPHVLPALDEGVAALQSLLDRRDAGGTGDALRVFYLSNMPVEFAAILEQRFTWFARFDGGIFSGRAKLSKPDAAIYAALESQYSLDPKHTLFLDDSAPNIHAAQARGWRTVHVREPADVPRGLRAHGLLSVSA
jgi:putative hydrolase of the HAD superfamily